MRSKSALDEILDKVSAMPLEEQQMVVEILGNRFKEKRRDEILANAQETLEEYRKGLTSKGAVTDLLQELASD